MKDLALTSMKGQELGATLAQSLGPEYISTRPGPHGAAKLSYIEGWKAISLANEVFGFDGWNSEVKRCDVDCCDPVGEKFNITVTAVVRITLVNGTYHEDLGIGLAENSKKGPGIEKVDLLCIDHSQNADAIAVCQAKKEAVTDALKRALRMFGNVMGNCLYDKNYLTNVSKIKVGAPRFDQKNLYRRAEFSNAPVFNRENSVPPSAMPTPVFAERGEFDDSFRQYGDDDYAASISDSVASTTSRSHSVQARQDDRTNSMPPPPNRPMNTPNFSRSSHNTFKNEILEPPSRSTSNTNIVNSNLPNPQASHSNTTSYQKTQELPLRNMTIPQQAANAPIYKNLQDASKPISEETVFGQSVANIKNLNTETPNNYVHNSIGGQSNTAQAEIDRKAASAARLAAMSMALQPPSINFPSVPDIKTAPPQMPPNHELKRGFSGKFEFTSAKGLLKPENDSDAKKPRMSY